MKEKLKKFWDDHKAAIIGVGAGAAWFAAWLLYVKHNTTDLPGIEIPEGKCYGFYEQFGERTLNADVPMCMMSDLAKRLMDEGWFSKDAEAFVMFSEKI